MFSQSLEEFFIIREFIDKPPAKFIDIGSYDVFRFSNVRALYDKLKWSGLMIEPAPSNYTAIANHYKDEPRVEVLQLAIGAETKEIDFYDSSGDAVSTSDVNHMKLWGGAGVKFNKIKVQQLSVEDFFKEYLTEDVKFINIDVEAMNIDVFRRIPDYVFEQISLLCIEHDTHDEEMKERLAPFGFANLYQNAENILLAK